VELFADLQTGISRNEKELRRSSRSSKRDIEASQKRLLAVEDKYQLDSRGAFPFPDDLRIDNTHLQPRVVAEQFAAHFGLTKGSEAGGPLSSPN
jgi:hypothetical protein